MRVHGEGGQGLAGVDDEKGSLFLWCVAMTHIIHNGTWLSPGHGGRYYQNKRLRFTYIMCPLPPLPPPKKKKKKLKLAFICRASQLLCQPNAVGNIANTLFILPPTTLVFLSALTCEQFYILFTVCNLLMILIPTLICQCLTSSRHFSLFPSDYLTEKPSLMGRAYGTWNKHQNNMKDWQVQGSMRSLAWLRQREFSKANYDRLNWAFRRLQRRSQRLKAGRKDNDLKFKCMMNSAACWQTQEINLLPKQASY